MQASRGCCKIDRIETISVSALNLTWEFSGFTKGESGLDRDKKCRNIMQSRSKKKCLLS